MNENELYKVLNDIHKKEINFQKVLDDIKTEEEFHRNELKILKEKKSIIKFLENPKDQSRLDFILKIAGMVIGIIVTIILSL